MITIDCRSLVITGVELNHDGKLHVTLEGVCQGFVSGSLHETALRLKVTADRGQVKDFALGQFFTLALTRDE